MTITGCIWSLVMMHAVVSPGEDLPTGADLSFAPNTLFAQSASAAQTNYPIRSDSVSDEATPVGFVVRFLIQWAAGRALDVVVDRTLLRSQVAEALRETRRFRALRDDRGLWIPVEEFLSSVLTDLDNLQRDMAEVRFLALQHALETGAALERIGGRLDGIEDHLSHLERRSFLLEEEMEDLRSRVGTLEGEVRRRGLELDAVRAGQEVLADLMRARSHFRFGIDAGIAAVQSTRHASSSHYSPAFRVGAILQVDAGWGGFVEVLGVSSGVSEFGGVPRSSQFSRHPTGAFIGMGGVFGTTEIDQTLRWRMSVGGLHSVAAGRIGVSARLEGAVRHSIRESSAAELYVSVMNAWFPSFPQDTILEERTERIAGLEIGYRILGFPYRIMPEGI